MNNAFTLNPNLSLLDKYGYTFVPLLEIDAVWKEEQRAAIEGAFKAILENNTILEHYDTLLYICLVESNNAELQLRHKHYTYKNYKRIKELAQLLLLFKPGQKHRPSHIKASSVLENIKVTDEVLIEWLGATIAKAIEALEFNPTDFGETIFDFTSNEDAKDLLNAQSLNYFAIEKLANQNIRKPGIRERNKYLSNFLLRVWNFIENETLLTTKTSVQFSDNQLNFLFKVAELFEWLKGIDFESEEKDYIYILLANRIKL